VADGVNGAFNAGMQAAPPGSFQDLPVEKITAISSPVRAHCCLRTAQTVSAINAQPGSEAAAWQRDMHERVYPRQLASC
jgi:hypothetical protein